jgi:hypothetical protein
MGLLDAKSEPTAFPKPNLTRRQSAPRNRSSGGWCDWNWINGAFEFHLRGIIRRELSGPFFICDLRADYAVRLFTFIANRLAHRISNALRHREKIGFRRRLGAREEIAGECGANCH